jgi:tRNA G18 (ribose-2'-O)-methylase SpoU
VELPHLDAPDDPRLADFVALNDPVQRRRVERQGGYFVVEGALALEQLLRTPGWSIRQVVLLPQAAARFGTLLEHVAERTAIAPPEVVEAVVGFDLHRGVLASVERQPRVALQAGDLDDRPLLLAAQGVNDHENLGALYRNAAAFGATVVLDERCADPFYRRSVRVSLGHVLAVPTRTTPAGAEGVHALQAAGATVLALTPAGDIALHDIRASELAGQPVAVLVGAEGPGLDDGAIAAADVRVRIEMAPGVDSLNVSVAAALALHHLRSGRVAVSPQVPDVVPARPTNKIITP